MKVKPLLQSINPSTFLQDYLQVCGVKDVDKYLNAGLEDMDSPWLYPNMQEGVERLKKAISCGEQIGILQDVDSDGAMSASIASDFLIKHGVQPIVFYHTGQQHGICLLKDGNMLQPIIDFKIKLLCITATRSAEL